MKNLLFLVFVLSIPTFGQAPYQPNAAEIKLRMQKLNFLGSVLYVAAHPDDENTAVITYLSKGKLATTGYLSMTRGDGGQNLIGPEISELLGLIRTQELLAARRIDGGTQFFTRANDFGFSKSADETLKIWGKEQILSDVVRVYRQFQPDVILTRFPPDERAGHGHHTASAMLAIEAFDASPKTDVYPDQLKSLSGWQPKRLFINTGRFFNNAINENTPGVFVMNVGGYSSILGESFTEIAATSRSQHKSQGFGSRKTRGDRNEFFELVKGEPATTDIFDGVNTTWSRIKGGDKVKPLVDKLIAEYNYENPSASVPLLLQIRNEIYSLEEGVWRNRKLQEVEQLIQDCIAIYVEVTANQYWVAPGQPMVAITELLNRSETEVQVLSMQESSIGIDTVLNLTLNKNIPVTIRSRKSVDSKSEYSSPYWLRESHNQGLYTVSNDKLIGKPENSPAVQITFKVKIAGVELILTRPLVYRATDPVKGEQYRPFEILPPVTLNLSNSVFVFNNESSRDVSVIIKSSVEEKLSGQLKLQLPEGWRSEPSAIDFELKKKGEEQVKTFKVFPSKNETTDLLKAVAEVNGNSFSYSLQTIEYDHIPTQTLLTNAHAKIVRIDLKKEGKVIGYIKGAGDEVPNALRNMGYEVWEMKDEEVTQENLKRADAVVLGIRALNTNERIRFMMNNLLAYVNDGGTMIVQYNVSNGLLTDNFSPFPLTLSRDRVTEEDAEVRFINPEHPILNSPNKITANDFKGWVQERGLYFPNKWDPQYQPVLSMNDTKDKPMDGSLLVAQYGKGYYVYTGLSFFRELPDGVAGAYKLFANMVSLGKPKPEQPKSTKLKSKK